MKKIKTLFIDIETSGLPPKIEVPGKRPGTTKKEQLPYETGFMDYPHIVSMAWAVNDGEIKYHIINQEGGEIPQEAINIHGITNEMVAESEVKLEQVISLFLKDAIGSDIVVGHGLYFDTSIIKANILRIAGEGDTFTLISETLHKYKRIDTMRSTAKMMKGWPTLQELHMKIFHKGFEPHIACNDVQSLRECYNWLLKKGIVPTLEELQKKAKEKEEANGS